MFGWWESLFNWTGSHATALVLHVYGAKFPTIYLVHTFEKILNAYCKPGTVQNVGALCTLFNYHMHQLGQMQTTCKKCTYYVPGFVQMTHVSLNLWSSLHFQDFFLFQKM